MLHPIAPAPMTTTSGADPPAIVNPSRHFFPAPEGIPLQHAQGTCADAGVSLFLLHRSVRPTTLHDDTQSRPTYPLALGRAPGPSTFARAAVLPCARGVRDTGGAGG